MSERPSPRQIAVIGSGGAGLASAWLLQSDAEVTLFERDETPGGHATTLVVDSPRGRVPVELGFRYVFPWTYPNLTAFLKAVGVKLQQHASSMSFRGPDGGPTITVPPTSLAQAGRLAARGTNVLRAMSFVWFLRAGQSILKSQDWGPSLQEFLASSRIPKAITDQYLVPALAASWGAPIEAMVNFPAYDVLRVVQQGKTAMPHYYTVPGGTSQYVAAVLADAPAVRLHTNAGIERLARVGSQWELFTASGSVGVFDSVVIATPAEPAAALLATAGHPLARTVGGFRHFDTDIVIHGDTHFMPPERDAWTVVNVQYDGRHAWNTEWPGVDQDVEVFRTWLPPGHPMPEKVLARRHFRHLIVDAESRGRQAAIASAQGTDGIYLAGMYTCDVDNHESAISSAVKVAERLAPRSVRLRLFQHIRETTDPMESTRRPAPASVGVPVPAMAMVR